MVNPITFKSGNKIFTVDTVNQPNLWRSNAMTWYQFVFPYLIVANRVMTNVETLGPVLFYLIFTQEAGWVEVDVNTGKTVINNIRNATNPSKSWADMVEEEDM